MPTLAIFRYQIFSTVNSVDIFLQLVTVGITGFLLGPLETRLICEETSKYPENLPVAVSLCPEQSPLSMTSGLRKSGRALSMPTSHRTARLSQQTLHSPVTVPSRCDTVSQPVVALL